MHTAYHAPQQQQRLRQAPAVMFYPRERACSSPQFFYASHDGEPLRHASFFASTADGFITRVYSYDSFDYGGAETAPPASYHTGFSQQQARMPHRASEQPRQVRAEQQNRMQPLAMRSEASYSSFAPSRCSSRQYLDPSELPATPTRPTSQIVLMPCHSPAPRSHASAAPGGYRPMLAMRASFSASSSFGSGNSAEKTFDADDVTTGESDEESDVAEDEVVDGDDLADVTAGHPRKRERWSREEHEAFLRGVVKFGRAWKRVQALTPSRTLTQVRTHAYGYFHKLEKQGLVKADQDPVAVIVAIELARRDKRSNTTRATIPSSSSSPSALSLASSLKTAAAAAAAATAASVGTASQTTAAAAAGRELAVARPPVEAAAAAAAEIAKSEGEELVELAKFMAALKKAPANAVLPGKEAEPTSRGGNFVGMKRGACAFDGRGEMLVKRQRNCEATVGLAGIMRVGNFGGYSQGGADCAFGAVEQV